MADLKRIDPSTVRPDGGKTALSPPERRCHTTHHTGCVCWEATRDAKLAAAESRATRAEQDADALAIQLGTVVGYLTSANELLRPDDIDEECAECDEILREAREVLAQHAAK